MEEVAQGFCGLNIRNVAVAFENLLGKGIAELYEPLSADGRVGDGVVVVDDIVEARLEEVVVEPVGDLGFHLAEFLGRFCATHAVHQVGLSGEPVAHHVFVGIVGG